MDINTCFATTAEIRNLAFYSHAIPALAVMVLGYFVYAKAIDRRKAGIFLAFAATFTLWLIADLVNWVTNDYALLAATWAPLDYLNIVFFLLLLYFVYVDVSSPTTRLSLSGLVLLGAGLPFLITVTGNAVYEFNQPVCEMLSNEFLAQYKLILELVILLVVLCLGIVHGVRSHTRNERIRIGLITGSIFLFMGAFALAEYESVVTEVYEIMLYTLFTLPIFILMLTMAITSYGTFQLGDAAVRVLFYVFLVLAATQFFFVNDFTGFLLALMSFSVILILGLMLFFTSEREIRQRRLIEVMNKQQENLLRFIGHEVKGYLAKSEAAFAGIVQGDYGATSTQLSTMARTGLLDMKKGVDMVGDILDASNLRKGTVSYEKKSFDFKNMVQDVVQSSREAFEKKGLVFNVSFGEGTYTFLGDETKLRRHLIRNLVDNALHYTPSGSVTVTLSRIGNAIRFSVKDTGVGITPEDMRNLFTEGGHGKESLKINVDSTGYGLFIAKQVTEAHSGRIWAESKGQGSEFIVELPITA